jgi:lysophospholipase L1-like esterase
MGQDRPSQPMPMQVPKKLVVLGDSGVYGWGDPEQGGWCERLRRHWMDLPLGPVLYGLGVRGDGLERLAARAEAEVTSRGELRRQRPQGILLSIGLNDTARVGRPDGRHQLAPDAFLFGLEQLLPRLRAMAPLFVLGLTPVDEAVMPFADVLWYDLATVRHYEGLLEEACMEADVPFLPLLDGLLAEPGWLQWLCSDGLHLNGDGHGEVYECVRRWPALLHWAGLESRGTLTAAV